MSKHVCTHMYTDAHLCPQHMHAHAYPHLTCMHTHTRWGKDQKMEPIKFLLFSMTGQEKQKLQPQTKKGRNQDIKQFWTFLEKQQNQHPCSRTGARLDQTGDSSRKWESHSTEERGRSVWPGRHEAMSGGRPGLKPGGSLPGTGWLLRGVGGRHAFWWRLLYCLLRMCHHENS